MASRNGHSVFDVITDGWSRKITDFNGNGSKGVSIPADYARDHNIEIGDAVAIKKQDGDAPVLELHFDPNTEEEHEE